MKYIELTVCDEYVIITYMMQGKIQQLNSCYTAQQIIKERR